MLLNCNLKEVLRTVTITNDEAIALITAAVYIDDTTYHRRDIIVDQFGLTYWWLPTDNIDNADTRLGIWVMINFKID